MNRFYALFLTLGISIQLWCSESPAESTKKAIATNVSNPNLLEKELQEVLATSVKATTSLQKRRQKERLLLTFTPEAMKDAQDVTSGLLPKLHEQKSKQNNSSTNNSPQRPSSLPPFSPPLSAFTQHPTPEPEQVPVPVTPQLQEELSLEQIEELFERHTPNGPKS